MDATKRKDYPLFMVFVQGAVPTTLKPPSGTTKASDDLVKSTTSGTLAGLLAYGPLPDLIGMPRIGTTDEIFGLSAAAAAALIVSATSVPRACAEVGRPVDNQLRNAILGGSGGLFGGITLAQAITAVGFTLVDGGIMALTMVVGAAAPTVLNYLPEKKSCDNQRGSSHRGWCHEKICGKCGFLFAPNPSFKDNFEPKSFPSMTWHDVASFFHYRKLNYKESLAIAWDHFAAWNLRQIKHGDAVYVSARAFKDWLDINGEGLAENYEDAELPGDLKQLVDKYSLA